MAADTNYLWVMLPVPMDTDVEAALLNLAASAPEARAVLAPSAAAAAAAVATAVVAGGPSAAAGVGAGLAAAAAASSSSADPAPAAGAPAPVDPRPSPQSLARLGKNQNIAFLCGHATGEHVKYRLRTEFSAEVLARLAEAGGILNATADPSGNAKWELVCSKEQRSHLFWGPGALVHEYSVGVREHGGWARSNQHNMKNLCVELGLDPDWAQDTMKQERMVCFRLVLRAVAEFAKTGIQVLFGYDC